MLDLHALSDDPEGIRRRLGERGYHDPALERLVMLVRARRRVILEAERLRAERNEVSKALGAVRDKASAAFVAKRDAMREVGDRIQVLDAERGGIEAELSDLAALLPNLPHDTAPPGLSEADNRLVRSWGEKPSFTFPVRDHVDIGTALGVLDFKRATALSGARFSILTGLGARLQRALIAFMLDLHREEHGYVEVWPPALVKGSALFSTGQLPKFADGLFKIAESAAWAEHQRDTGAAGEPQDLYLSPTAEVQLTNLHAQEVLPLAALPLAYTAYAPCFRSEAGSYGRDTRGLIRQHQFDKVELVRIVSPDTGASELERLTGHAEAVLQRLGLHYRVMALCAGDMGFAAQKSYDLEVWLPGQDGYREISSCSWCGDFQARRAKIRYRQEEKGKPSLVHTLNGSGLAIGRTVVALLEQYQQADGSVVLPAALKPYLGGLDRLSPT